MVVNARMEWEAESGRNDGVCKRQAQACFQTFASLDFNLHFIGPFLSFFSLVTWYSGSD
jgi:hypothetical protein